MSPQEQDPMAQQAEQTVESAPISDERAAAAEDIGRSAALGMYRLDASGNLMLPSEVEDAQAGNANHGAYENGQR